LLAVVATAEAAPVPPSSDAILLSENSGGILELEGERRLDVSGFHGMIALRQGKAGELRFAARRLEGERVKQPVALWLDGTTLRIRPIEGSADTALRLEVSMSPSLSARLSTADSQIHISGLHGEVEVQAVRSSLTLRSVDGSVDLDLEKVTLELDGVSEGLTLAGNEVEGELQRVNGLLTLTLENSVLEVSGVHGEVEADLDESELSITDVAGRMRIDAAGGHLDLGGCKGGAELFLEETSLSLFQTEGPIEIDTDAEVKFDGHKGSLKIQGIGATIRGVRASEGLAEIETSNAEVILEGLEGAAQVRGANLDVQIAGSKGDLSVETTSSTVVILNPEGPVTVTNDFGDIRVEGAAKTVKIDSRDGEVRVLDLKGNAEIKAEGTEVEVVWTSLPGTQTSSVENSRGDVRVVIPAKFRCRIDASAPFGRIISEMDDLRVTDDGHHASGIHLGGARPAAQVRKPTIRLNANGDVYIDVADPLPTGR
jgi:hypothetical protein